MKCLVLHPDIGFRDTRRTPEHALSEAVSLAAALDLHILDALVVRLPKARAGLLFGSGKIDELAQIITANDVDLVMIDGPVTPIQQRNLERRWRTKVIDRTGLILEIFGARARTREGVLQVDLAALSYQKSRLVRSWTHLERQRGGLSFVGGAGETQIEADRRAIDDAIVRLKRQLKKVRKTRALHRAARARVPFPIVALVGYTNAGKSTIFNRLTGAGVLVKDMLFATLDPTMRSVELAGGKEVILSDTVGFISDLPTQLVAAFRATLEDVLDADLILHVRDISHPDSKAQAADVLDILNQMGVRDPAQNTMIEVWNKVDMASDLAALPANGAVKTSALNGAGFDDLQSAIETALLEKTTGEVLTLGFEDGKKRAWLFDQNIVSHEDQTDNGFTLSVNWTQKQARRFSKL